MSLVSSLILKMRWGALLWTMATCAEPEWEPSVQEVASDTQKRHRTKQRVHGNVREHVDHDARVYRIWRTKNHCREHAVHVHNFIA